MAPQDSIFDDEEDTCPLCVEEFDLSDRNFRPCPCGYQICQFCYNNIKQNINGLCPACRRPYDEKSIQWRVVTAEEYTEFRATIAKNQKKRAAEQRQKEAQKREADKDNRKNLVGVRVVQKNLVYVTGLAPTVREDELLKTLRQPQFFGQYGNIQKISISNRKTTDGHTPALGVYVTFDTKEEAQRCIQAVNGSTNSDRVLKAQLGTTKYCSAWLRHEQCGNRQCMFLHELGDEEDSYTRQDLSSMNSIDRQRPLPNPGPSSRSASRQQMQSSTSQASSQAMARSSSNNGSENDDASALPSSANWARHPQVRSRRGSHATSGAASSPAISQALPVTAESVLENESAVEEAPTRTPSAQDNPIEEQATASADAQPLKPKKDPRDLLLSTLLKVMHACPSDVMREIDEATLNAYPPLFDVRGGERRRGAREDDDAQLGPEQDDQVEPQDPLDDEPEAGGSLALGGEPEDREQGRDGQSFDQRRLPIRGSNGDNTFGSVGASYAQQNAGLGTIGSRTMTPQQQQASSAFGRSQGSFADQMPSSLISPQPNLFQGQGGHNRNSSRFSFANESTGNTTSVNLAANPGIMAQQKSMMPPPLHSQQSNPYYASSMPGPPPGLKSARTPPSMFGQGHSGFGAPKEGNMSLEGYLRGRGGASSQAHDAGKLDLVDPSILRMQQHQQSNAGVGQGLFGGQAQGGYNPSMMYNAGYPTRW